MSIYFQDQLNSTGRAIQLAEVKYMIRVCVSNDNEISCRVSFQAVFSLLWHHPWTTDSARNTETAIVHYKSVNYHVKKSNNSSDVNARRLLHYFLYLCNNRKFIYLHNFYTVALNFSYVPFYKISCTVHYRIATISFHLVRRLFNYTCSWKCQCHDGGSQGRLSGRV